MKIFFLCVPLFLAVTAPALAHECAMKKFSVSKADIVAVQKDWGDGIVSIGKSGSPKEDAIKHIDQFYAYNLGAVFFKPTKAAEEPFRDTEEEALSYFVGGKEKEDTGFALTPFTAVRFANHTIYINCDYAVAQGHYYFTQVNQQEIKVEYTLGYILDPNGHLKISLQHSSLPFQPIK